MPTPPSLKGWGSLLEQGDSRYVLFKEFGSGQDLRFITPTPLFEGHGVMDFIIASEA